MIITIIIIIWHMRVLHMVLDSNINNNNNNNNIARKNGESAYDIEKTRLIVYPVHLQVYCNSKK